MGMTKISASNIAVLNLGFRIFFLGAGAYSILAIFLWTGVFSLNYAVATDTLSAFQWHAHEMIYGYCAAVISGFILTAVKNWTGIQTVHGSQLAFIFCLWLIARLLFLFAPDFVFIAAILDLAFITAVIIAAAYPIIKSRNWRQLGILSK